MDFVAGILLGVLFYFLYTKQRKTSGTVIIDLTESAENSITLKFTESLNSIYSKKQIIFNVEVREDDSLN